MKSRLSQYGLAVIILMVILHVLANTFYWYVTVFWYDMMMHTLGGVFLSVFFASVWNKWIGRLSKGQIILLLLGTVLIIGVGWEAFEYIVQYAIKGSTRLADINDSISDVLCDMTGGILGTFFVLRYRSRYNRIHE